MVHLQWQVFRCRCREGFKPGKLRKSMGDWSEVEARFWWLSCKISDCETGIANISIILSEPSSIFFLFMYYYNHGFISCSVKVVFLKLTKWLWWAWHCAPHILWKIQKKIQSFYFWGAYKLINKREELKLATFLPTHTILRLFYLWLTLLRLKLT